jgi:hypothetical protein
MSNDLMKSTNSYLATSSDGEIGRAAGSTLFKAGVGGGALWLTAGFLPFVTFPMLLVLAVLLGGGLYLKNS